MRLLFKWLISNSCVNRLDMKQHTRANTGFSLQDEDTQSDEMDANEAKYSHKLLLSEASFRLNSVAPALSDQVLHYWR